MRNSRPDVVIPSDAELARRRVQHARLAQHGYTQDLRYDPRARTFRFRMRSGATVTVPLVAIAEFRGASAAQLLEVRLASGGAALEHRGLDIDISVPGLLRDVFGFGELQQRRAGSVKSQAKAKAARANGAKGGRPPKARTA